MLSHRTPVHLRARRHAAAPCIASSRPSLLRYNRLNVVAASLVASSAAVSTAKLTLSVHCSVSYGTTLTALGSCAALGGWDVSNGLSLSWNEGDIWTAVVELPAGSKEEYTYVKTAANTEAEWMPGGNLRIELPADTVTAQCKDSWDNNSHQVIVTERSPPSPASPTTIIAAAATAAATTTPAVEAVGNSQYSLKLQEVRSLYKQMEAVTESEDDVEAVAHSQYSLKLREVRRIYSDLAAVTEAEDDVDAVEHSGTHVSAPKAKEEKEEELEDGGEVHSADESPTATEYVASATEAVTSSATEAVTSSATEAVTSSATEAVTSSATEAVTSSAAEAVTLSTTEAVTSSAAEAVTSSATAVATPVDAVGQYKLKLRELYRLYREMEAVTKADNDVEAVGYSQYSLKLQKLRRMYKEMEAITESDDEVEAVGAVGQLYTHVSAPMAGLQEEQEAGDEGHSAAEAARFEVAMEELSSHAPPATESFTSALAITTPPQACVQSVEAVGQSVEVVVQSVEAVGQYELKLREIRRIYSELAAVTEEDEEFEDVVQSITHVPAPMAVEETEVEQEAKGKAHAGDEAAHGKAAGEVFTGQKCSATEATEVSESVSSAPSVSTPVDAVVESVEAVGQYELKLREVLRIYSELAAVTEEDEEVETVGPSVELVGRSGLELREASPMYRELGARRAPLMEEEGSRVGAAVGGLAVRAPSSSESATSAPAVTTPYEAAVQSVEVVGQYELKLREVRRIYSQLAAVTEEDEEVEAVAQSVESVGLSVKAVGQSVEAAGPSVESVGLSGLTMRESAMYRELGARRPPLMEEEGSRGKWSAVGGLAGQTPSATASATSAPAVTTPSKAAAQPVEAVGPYELKLREVRRIYSELAAVTEVDEEIETVAWSVEPVGSSIEVIKQSGEAVGSSVEAAGPSVEAVGPSVVAVRPSVEAVGLSVEAVGPSVEAVGQSGLLLRESAMYQELGARRAPLMEEEGARGGAAVGGLAGQTPSAKASATSAPAVTMPSEAAVEAVGLYELKLREVRRIYSELAAVTEADEEVETVAQSVEAVGPSVETVEQSVEAVGSSVEAVGPSVEAVGQSGLMLRESAMYKELGARRPPLMEEEGARGGAAVGDLAGQTPSATASAALAPAVTTPSEAVAQSVEAVAQSVEAVGQYELKLREVRRIYSLLAAVTEEDEEAEEVGQSVEAVGISVEVVEQSATHVTSPKTDVVEEEEGEEETAGSKAAAGEAPSAPSTSESVSSEPAATNSFDAVGLHELMLRKMRRTFSKLAVAAEADDEVKAVGESVAAAGQSDTHALASKAEEKEGEEAQGEAAVEELAGRTPSAPESVSPEPTVTPSVEAVGKYQLKLREVRRIYSQLAAVTEEDEEVEADGQLVEAVGRSAEAVGSSDAHVPAANVEEETEEEEEEARGATRFAADETLGEASVEELAGHSPSTSESVSSAPTVTPPVEAVGQYGLKLREVRRIYSELAAVTESGEEVETVEQLAEPVGQSNTHVSAPTADEVKVDEQDAGGKAPIAAEETRHTAAVEGLAGRTPSPPSTTESVTSELTVTPPIVAVGQYELKLREVRRLHSELAAGTEAEEEEEVDGQSVEAVGQSVEAVGQSVEAVGQSVEAVGQSVEAVGAIGMSDTQVLAPKAGEEEMEEEESEGEVHSADGTARHSADSTARHSADGTARHSADSTARHEAAVGELAGQAPSETTSVITTPAETESVTTTPSETESVTTTPAETEAVTATPAEAEPVSTTQAEAVGQSRGLRQEADNTGDGDDVAFNTLNQSNTSADVLTSKGMKILQEQNNTMIQNQGRMIQIMEELGSTLKTNELDALKKSHAMLERQYWAAKTKLLDAELSAGEMRASRERAVAGAASALEECSRSMAEVNEQRTMRIKLESDLAGCKAWIRSMEETERKYGAMVEELVLAKDTRPAAVEKNDVTSL